MARINLTVQYDDIGINVSRQGQQAVLHIADVVIGSETRPEHLISTDPNNDLKLGSDNKLMVATDELNTSFEYASSVAAFWSI